MSCALLFFVASTSWAATPWQELDQSKWVAESGPHPRHLVYVITDANCPYCHELWSELRPYYRRGLAVRYVMVGILTDSSPGKAAAILEARDPAAALDRAETGWNTRPDDFGGGIAPLAHPDPAVLAELMGNEGLMHELGVQGTPALIYRDAAGRLHLVQSVPDAKTLTALVRAAAPD
ncbi:MAG TPA: thiol:disulfide interchange protein DsbG [Gammaproteobacteria bacterium]|nr:thiol:disulfide interchange protein DsbG [Gammaproteobacteria bacterium]